MIQIANPVQDLLQAVYSCISDFNDSYARITKAPREEWAFMMGEAFGSLLSHHMEILQCSKRVADLTNTHLYHSIVPETFTMAIHTATDLHLKAMRNEVFRVMSEQLTAKNEHDLDAYTTSTYSFAEEDLRELSYLIPGQNGWVHVCPNSKLERFLNTHNGDQFSVELQVHDSKTVHYGVYKASIMPGQAMSGLEFAELSFQTRNKIANSLCRSHDEEEEDSSAEFQEVMEDLLHSRITLSCIFLECIQGPSTPNTSIESHPVHITNDAVTPAYLSEDALLPTRDSVPAYFAPRLVHSEPNLSDSENEVEEVDDILLDFSSIGSRRWRGRGRKGTSPPPFGVIGDLGRPSQLFATSTPNVSDGGADDYDDDDDDDDYEDEDEEDDIALSDGARTPIAISFTYTSESQETSSLSESEISYYGARNVSEPLRPIHINGQLSKAHFLRLNSSFPCLPPRKSDFESAESSFSKNNSEPHIGQDEQQHGHDNSKSVDETDEEVLKDFSFLNIIEQETPFLRPSSALAGLTSPGSGAAGSGTDTSLSEPDSPIWNTCRLRKMTSAPAMPRRAAIEKQNQKLNEGLGQGLNWSYTSGC